ncbi:tail fiber assembly protein [Pseudomonas sp.]|uniref:tail fiber assembly protein n=1 Tax=Pseudomonas sp. TaxID=306 RepID=UPI001B289CAE|nr:tail fiber assembly protein [Pseudomonas sp.]MBO9552240.1 tail fiber assembly protein [Pseudomonas sp.]
MPFAANGKISTDAFEGAVEITDDQYMRALEGMLAGYSVVIDDGFQVLPPPEPPEPEQPKPPTLDELKAQALAQRDGLLALAALRIAPLQDAVDLDDATADETALLKKWKQYRVLLNRVSDQASFPETIDWPAPPA